ncbi:hypothetical protein F4811DRAFT_522272 [Daldinia bambusicola]|nr:hypothetical protein F4811DRAFT_522272 [Daldinia bambusicola]
MCTESFAIYPCSHKRSTWDYCGKAKTKAILKRGPPVPCDGRMSIQIPPDLEESCGLTCLSRTFQCSSCGVSNQIGWVCSRCKCVRNADTKVFIECECRMHNCFELTYGKPGEAFCDTCQKECDPAAQVEPSLRARRTGPKLHWQCHKCARKLSAPGTAMKCDGPRGCGHRRCGHCHPLFRCGCKCGCTYHFVRGGTQPCYFCIKSCLKEGK